MMAARQKIHNLLCSDSRSSLILKNVLASFFVKGWSAIVVLLMVPLTLKCLGVYKNGVWLTISSLLVWIDQMDIGLGNGMRNKLATYIAHEDYRNGASVVSSTIAMLLCIVIVVFSILALLITYTDVFSFLNVEPSSLPELRVALFSAVILVCVTFVLKVIGNLYMALQLPAVSNLIIAIGQTLALFLTWLLYVTDKASFLNVVVVNTAAPLLPYICAYFYTFYFKYPQLRPHISLINIRTAISLGNIGISFFWIQAATLIQYMSANILISKLFSPAMVTPYQIAYRYLSLIVVAFTVICMPYWSATTDAYERGDIQWIQTSNKKLNFVIALIAMALVLMTLLSPFVYSIWIGNKCDVPFGITVMMATYIFLLIVSMRYSYILNGLGALRMQLYMTFTAIIFIPLAWFVSELTHDIVCFMFVMCICVLPGTFTNMIQLNKILKGKATGIWRIGA